MTDNNQQPTTPPEGTTGTQPGTPAATPSPERTFTQADIDRIVSGRLSDQKKSIEAQFADHAALKDKASQWDKHEESQKTELQKIQDAANVEAKKLQDQLDILTKERETLSTTARTATTQAAIMAAASAAGIVGTQLEATVKLVDQSKLIFDDKGALTNAAAMVTELITQYDFLKPAAAQPTSPAKPGAKINPTNPAGTSDTKGTLAWHRVNRTSESTFQGGGVRAPDGDKK